MFIYTVFTWRPSIYLHGVPVHLSFPCARPAQQVPEVVSGERRGSYALEALGLRSTATGPAVVAAVGPAAAAAAGSATAAACGAGVQRRRQDVADYCRPGWRPQRSRHDGVLHSTTDGAVVQLVEVDAVEYEVGHDQPRELPGQGRDRPDVDVGLIKMTVVSGAPNIARQPSSHLTLSATAAVTPGTSSPTRCGVARVVRAFPPSDTTTASGAGPQPVGELSRRRRTAVSKLATSAAVSPPVPPHDAS